LHICSHHIHGTCMRFTVRDYFMFVTEAPSSRTIVRLCPVKKGVANLAEAVVTLKYVGGAPSAYAARSRLNSAGKTCTCAPSPAGCAPASWLDPLPEAGAIANDAAGSDTATDLVGDAPCDAKGWGRGRWRRNQACA
jgi:hypothetical protein